MEPQCRRIFLHWQKMWAVFNLEKRKILTLEICIFWGRGIDWRYFESWRTIGNTRLPDLSGAWLLEFYLLHLRKISQWNIPPLGMPTNGSHTSSDLYIHLNTFFALFSPFITVFNFLLLVSSYVLAEITRVLCWRFSLFL